VSRLFLLATVTFAVTDPGYSADRVAESEATTVSGEAALSARAAANEANDVAVKSIGVTEHAQSSLKVARNALRDARASSGGLSDNQKTLLKDAESQLREATLSAEYGKLQQAQWMTAKGHYIKSSETSLKRLEDKLSTRTVGTGKSDAELEALRAEIERLRSELDSKTLEKQVKYVDNGATISTTDDRSDADLRTELENLEQMIAELENAEASGKASSLSHDEMKAETMRLQESIERLEAERMAEPGDDDIIAIKHKLAELEREEEIRKQQLELQEQIKIAIQEKKMQEREKMVMEAKILHQRRMILEKELGQNDDLTEEALQKEIEILRARIRQMGDGPDTGELTYEVPPQEDKELKTVVKKSQRGVSDFEAFPPTESSGRNPIREGLVEIGAVGTFSGKVQAPMAEPAAEGEEPCDHDGIDIDTEMPYGELEPFGREDTAQELTESSIRESDEMVDQLERAEVAEEKRAVFRALTRLRGAAITSYDGIARSQTGNIDEYNKIHKWRRTHPLHHLADEESDISKWAFPDNADF
jgi:uncharacterized small protein (DUF1192 family)